MAPPEIVNVDFFKLHQSITNLERALDDADRQKTAPKGARKPPVHKPLDELERNVDEDLLRVLNSPLRPPSRELAYGCLPLEAVEPVRSLFDMLMRVVGPDGDEDLLDDPDVDAELHARVQAFVASIDPNHPFLKVEFEFGGNGNGVGGGQTSSAEEKGKQVAVDDGQQQTSSANEKGKQVAVDDGQQQTSSANEKDKQVSVDDGQQQTSRAKGT